MRTQANNECQSVGRFYVNNWIRLNTDGLIDRKQFIKFFVDEIDISNY